MREVRIRSRGKGAWDESIDDLHDTTGTLDTSMIDLVNIDIETDENNVVTSARVVAEVEGVDVEIENEPEATDEDVHEKYDGPYLTLDQAGKDEEPEKSPNYREWLKADQDPQREAARDTVHYRSSMHEILTIIANYTAPGDEQGLRSTDIRSLVSKTASSGVSAHLSRLYDRLLVERKKVSATTAAEFTYRITEEGLQELERLGGPFDPDGPRAKPQVTPDDELPIADGSGYHEVLTLIADAGGNVTSRDIWNNSRHIQKQSVPAACSGLKKKGLIARVGFDNKAHVYNLTDEGLAVLEALGPHYDHQEKSVVPAQVSGDEDE